MYEQTKACEEGAEICVATPVSRVYRSPPSPRTIFNYRESTVPCKTVGPVCDPKICLNKIYILAPLLPVYFSFSVYQDYLGYSSPATLLS